eukprot:2416066-Rhodomonas_salina.8
MKGKRCFRTLFSTRNAISRSGLCTGRACYAVSGTCIEPEDRSCTDTGLVLRRCYAIPLSSYASARL